MPDPTPTQRAQQSNVPPPPTIRQRQPISHTITSEMILDAHAGATLRISDVGEMRTHLSGGNQPLAASTPPQPNNGKYQ